VPSKSESQQRAIDPRPARTRTAIFRAVEELVNANSDVTVNAIVQSAGVSRTAFYSQFADLDGLASAMLVEQFHLIGVDDVVDRGAPAADERDIARRAATRLVLHIHERWTFYSAALDWRVRASVHQSLADAFANEIAASMAVMGDRVPPQHRDGHTARYIGGGALALITAWLREEHPVPPDEMSTRLLRVMPDWLVGAP
jgi:AcrR family transcriptional regulator